MTKYSEVHLRLEMLADTFRKDPSDYNGDRLIAEMKKLIEQNEDLLYEGIETEQGIVPGGYYAPDGRFYFHVFSSNLYFTETMTGTRMVAGAKLLWNAVVQNAVVGGFSLNHTGERGTILITKEDLQS